MYLYNLTWKINDLLFNAKVRLPQVGSIAYNCPTKHLAKYGYTTKTNMTRMWMYELKHTDLTCIMDDFGVKYIQQEDTEHLKLELKTLYKVTNA